VTVLPGVTIGRGVTVGAGSVVTKSVEDFCVVVGNPAKVLRKIEEGIVDAKYVEFKKDREIIGASKNER
jgi:acetyltransferase-like isoleucine patch superfamily enzyme